MTRLQGQALLDKLASLDGATDGDRARACGFYSLKKDGSDRINFTAFYKACAMAKGVAFTSSGGRGFPSRELSYTGTVGTTGQGIIGPRYIEQLGMKPGDRFTIEVDASETDPCIVIMPGVDDEPTDDDVPFEVPATAPAPAVVA